jgi:hypothetical protein
VLQNEIYLGINNLEIVTGQYIFVLKNNNLKFIPMKKMFYSRLIVMLFTLLSVSLSAQDVFYVSASGDDANPGTQAQPWLTLNVNANQWTEGCTLKISGEVFITNTITLNKDLTFEGITPDAAIQALSDVDFASAQTAGFERMFIVPAGKTTTVKDLTLKNMKPANVTSGGMFHVSGILNLDNCTVKNADVGNGGGGAIFCQKEMHAANTIFDGNTAGYGAIIQLQGTDASTVITGEFQDCQFLNSVALESAIHMNNIIKGDFAFDRCYFYNNSATNSRGGALILKVVNNNPLDVNLSVTNSSFVNNTAAQDGAAIALNGSFNGASSSGALDFTIANCTFYNNTSANNSNGTAVSTVSLGGPNGSVSVTGAHVFANNTFYRNTKTSGGYASIFLYGQSGSDLYFVNNLLLEETVSGSQGIVLEAAFNSALPAEDRVPLYGYQSYTVKNNIFGRVGGTSYGSNPNYTGSYFLKEVNDAANNNTLLSDNNWATQPEDKAVTVGLATTLTAPATGVPYLALTDASGLAVDFGISSVLAGAANIVPQTDIASNPVSGNSRDAGAHEYTSSVGVNTSILLEGQPEAVHYYNLWGVEVSAPAKGQVYIAKEIYKSGAVKVRKVVK